ncbi:LppA family lipoprotein [Cellulomonas sp. P4]|uniref:LppA family lipoprotein n=1 Tax=Cellulomonas sp. P4 TaxID=3142533 RepID=UPI0031BA062C
MTRDGRSRAASRRLFWGLGASAVGAVVASCGPSSTDEELNAQMADRPTMEQMLDHYEPMLREMVAALDREIGGLDWYAAPDALPMGWANCSTEGAITEAQEFHPVGLTADGTYDRSDWDAVVGIIRDIGDRYGFEAQGHLIDRPTNMTFIGKDRYGASYSLDMGRNSVLALRTGCHLWEHEPGLDYTRRSPLDRPPPVRPTESPTPRADPLSLPGLRQQ